MRLSRTLCVVVALLLGGLVPFAARAGATTAPDPAPAVGTCHTMSWDTFLAASDPNSAVPCTDPHQSVTIATVSLPTDIGRTYDNAQWPYYGRTCWKAYAAAVGGWARADQSMYDWASFVPTIAQWKAGSRWVRCDLVLRGAPGLLQTLPAQPDGALTYASRKCATGKSSGYTSVPCTHGHQFRATTSLHIWRWESYQDAKAIALRVCSRRISGHFLYVTPWSKEIYRWGDQYAVCMPQTTS